MWGKDDIADAADVIAGTKQMRDGAKHVVAAINRIRDRHRKDATAPAWLREAHAEAEARHVEHEADDIERDIEVVHRMFEGGAA